MRQRRDHTGAFLPQCRMARSILQPAVGFCSPRVVLVCRRGRGGIEFSAQAMGAVATMETKDRSALDAARRLLADCPLFRGLTPDERNGLVARAHLRRFAAGETIFLMDA